jgi:hypothetical protein
VFPRVFSSSYEVKGQIRARRSAAGVAAVSAPLLRDARSGVAYDKDPMLAVAHAAADPWRVRKLGGASAVAML